MFESFFQRVWPSILAFWLQLELQLTERLGPMIENLRPIWSDPLWQLVALIFLVVVCFFSLLWCFQKGKETIIAILSLLYSMLVSPLIAFKDWVLSRFKKHAEDNQATFEKFKSSPHWVNRINVRKTLDAIRYLTTRRSWRYQSAWYLMSGSDDSRQGWLSSIKRGRRVQLSLKEKQLPADGSGWHFFDQGIIVDTPETHFDDIVRLLIRYRPERPVDGILLSVSARTLLNSLQSSADQSLLKNLGERLYKQLWTLQKQTGFVVPVYFLISDCEVIEGFEPFWQAQPEDQLGQMFGWSNPARLDTAYTNAWVHEAFVQIVENIKSAQLQLAAGEQGSLNDEFMLFDREFQQLEKPLGRVLESVFSHSSFYDAPPLRGIWFSGKVQDKMALNEDLLAYKVWPETHLAYPIEQRHFSINRTLRRFQYCALVIAGLLMLTLVIDSTRLIHYTREAEKSWSHMTVQKSDEDYCSNSGAQLWWLLSSLSKLSEQPFTVSLPASWNNGQIPEIRKRAATLLFPNVIFPALECRLKVRAKSLEMSVNDRVASITDLDQLESSLKRFANEILAYQVAQDSFVYLAGPLSSNTDVSIRFKALADYLFDGSIPATVDFASPLVSGAIVDSAYDIEWSENELVNHERQLSYLNKMTKRLREKIESHLSQPPMNAIQDAFFVSLNPSHYVSHDSNKMQAALLAFRDWSNYIEQQWLMAKVGDSPCSRVFDHLQQMQFVLDKAGYPKAQLNQAVSHFDRDHCDRPIIQRLEMLNVAPLGKLFERTSSGSLTFTDNLRFWQKEFASLSTLNLVARDYSDIDISTLNKALVGTVVEWKGEPLNEAVELMLGFQSFRQQWWLSSNHQKGEPFYAPALRQRLQQVIQGLILKAQQSTLVQKPTAMSVAHDTESLLAQKVNSFSRVESLIRQLTTLLNQEGDLKNAVELKNNSTQFVRDQLKSLTTLAKENRLYQPLNSPQWSSENFTAALFSYDSPAKIDDYLLSQRQRVNFLAQQYARPMVNYLLDNDGIGQYESNARYWYDTIMDIRRYQRQDPNSNVAQIENLIAQKLTSLSTQDCTQWKSASAVSQTHQASIFGHHYQKISQQINRYCEGFSKNTVMESYLALAKAFNSELAGRFPFAGITQAGSNDLDNIRVDVFVSEYLRRWGPASKDKPDDSLLIQLKNVINTRPELGLEQWYEFVQQLDDFVAFWQKGQTKEGQFNIPLEVEFAALPEQSVGMRQIIEWQLHSASSSLIYPNGGTQFSWQPGNALLLSLRWARGSDFTPVRNLTTPVQIDAVNHRALFTSKGRWGLFEWHKRFASMPQNLTHSQMNQRSLLAFDVPVSTKGKLTKTNTNPSSAVAYVSRVNMWMSAVIASRSGRVERIAIPSLPSLAPDAAMLMPNQSPNPNQTPTQAPKDTKEASYATTHP